MKGTMNSEAGEIICYFLVYLGIKKKNCKDGNLLPERCAFWLIFYGEIHKFFRYFSSLCKETLENPT